MLTYAALDLIVIATIGVYMALRPVHLAWKRIVLLLVVLLVLTAIFDSIIIGLHIVAYHDDKLTGLYIGKAPLEDFSYTIVASVFIPYVWLRSKNHDH